MKNARFMKIAGRTATSKTPACKGRARKTVARKSKAKKSKLNTKKLFAIADTHLSFTADKPMCVFGDRWKNHSERLASAWREEVSEDDTVIIAGDISWALKFADALADIDFLHKLPGKKILVRGNHDLWWQKITQLNQLYEDMRFLQNDHVFFDGEVAVCGSRGWGLPGLEDYGQGDEKILARELIRLEMSLGRAKEAEAKDIVCVLHFPPALKPENTSPFTELIGRYPVSQVVYGHLHGPQAFGKGIMGEHGGVDYRLVSLDYLDFRPLRIV